MSTQGYSHSAPEQAAGAAKAPGYRRIVVKAGTSVLTFAEGRRRGLDLATLTDLTRQISLLRREQGIEVLLVTSGAIAAGREGLGESWSDLGRDIPSRQVLAAVGQSRLMHTYQELFAAHEVRVAQTLLTIKDLSDRQSYLNVRNTLLGLLELGVVPILNENDVVAVDEIGEVFGDNDRLSALVANLVDADLLLILTDTDGLYTADPRHDPSARLIPVVKQVDAEIEGVAGTRLNPWARGGMPTKIDAARLVTTAGSTMILCHGKAKDAVLRAARGEAIGTLFQPAGGKLEARKRWMLGGISHRGEIRVDAGAARALMGRKVSLLPAGVKEVQGTFQRGDIVFIAEEGGERIACGIANYASADIERVRGRRSTQIEGILGYHYGQEVVHRNNLVLL
ncbi:MAG: glutamate 5-kinase [Dehalococcoidia bacterium]|nr:glutamate 5-kinase [Dehalococcoidia bacterium]MSQ16978.1 glutamate 5-kinase [Dehalococcoidia bacterium]